jgi:hypothetical protein
MNLLKKIIGKTRTPIKNYSDFWIWFKLNENKFLNFVKTRKNIERGFFNKLSDKLEQLNHPYCFLTGMADENTAELIFTADGIIKNFIFIEEMVLAAPPLNGWKITAHKPATDVGEFEIKMDGYAFNDKKLSFYANAYPAFPDEIELIVIHSDFTEENKTIITNGTYIFLDNYLGELNAATSIDNLVIQGNNREERELIPISKLKDYLNWRQKEFIEKYDGVRYSIENDEYSIFEAELESGNVLVATINTELLDWDSKASHPWILIAEFKYDGTQNNGMPDNETIEFLNLIENDISTELIAANGYLNVGRQTAEGMRELYYACSDFRKPSKVLYDIQEKYGSEIEITYDIYKDKYWQSFYRFTKNYSL